MEHSGGDPLLESRILLKLHLVRNRVSNGSTYLPTTEPRRVLALTEAFPDTEERALAFAHLAFAEAFDGSDEAPGHAESAVRLAELVETTPALVWAYGSRAQTRWGSDTGVRDAQRSFALALDHGDVQLLCWSATFLGNSLESAGLYADAAVTAVSAYRTLRDAGAFDYAASVGASAARWHFALGRWDQTRPMVRELLTISRSEGRSAASRCVAALLCAHEGKGAAALMHLGRAEELFPNASPVGNPLIETQILVSLALGDPRAALERISEHMGAAVHISPVAADEWLMYASHAATQLADHPANSLERQTALRLLERIETTRGEDPPPFAPLDPLDVIHPAFGALHAAQRAECFGAGAPLDQLWEAACTATAEAGLVYDHARAQYSLARHLLTRGHDRTRATQALVDARSIASDLGASPLVGRIDDLAAQAHLSLVPEEAHGSSSPGYLVTLPSGPPLTRREEEVLDGLLSGRTYAQIATSLFISDKTVSSHVSNVLRKTGTANRIELAERARRRRGAERT